MAQPSPRRQGHPTHVPGGRPSFVRFLARQLFHLPCHLSGEKLRTKRREPFVGRAQPLTAGYALQVGCARSVKLRHLRLQGGSLLQKLDAAADFPSARAAPIGTRARISVRYQCQTPSIAIELSESTADLLERSRILGIARRQFAARWLGIRG